MQRSMHSNLGTIFVVCGGNLYFMSCTFTHNFWPYLLYYHSYCNCLVDTECLASGTKKAASGLHSPFSGMMQGNVNTSLEISSRSQIKDRHLLSLDNCCRFYYRFALVHIDYKLIQFTYTNFTLGAGHGVLILQKTLINTRAIGRLVHINCTHSFQVQPCSLQILHWWLHFNKQSLSELLAH
jgi:hypothetical protein